MAVHMRLRNALTTIRLDGVSMEDYGTEALAGVTGLGLPPVSTQWVTGAGDGARYRGRRVQPRDLDIPIYIRRRTKAELEAEMSELALMFEKPFQLDLVEDDGRYWTTEVVRVGGGDYAYGVATDGEREIQTVVTVRAGDPFFTSSESQSVVVSNSGAGRGLLGTLTKLRVSASQAIGSMELANTGDATAYPTWEIHGPGMNLVLSANGQTLSWGGTLGAADVLHIDTKTASVRDQTGANRYGDLNPAPRFWALQSGVTVATVSLSDTTAASSIKATWYPRKWWVV